MNFLKLNDNESVILKFGHGDVIILYKIKLEDKKNKIKVINKIISDANPMYLSEVVDDTYIKITTKMFTEDYDFHPIYEEIQNIRELVETSITKLGDY